MNASTDSSNELLGPTTREIAEHLLVAIYDAATAGERADLETLSQGLGVRRSEARTVLSRLDQQGLIQVLRMRPTLVGFGVAQALKARGLAPLRKAASVATAPRRAPLRAA